MKRRRGNGSGTTYFDRGKWRAKYHVDGRRLTVTAGPEVDSKMKADAALREILVDIKRGVHKEPSKLTFSDFAPEWLANHCDRKQLKRTTRSNYQTILKHLLSVFGAKRVGDIDVATIEKFVARMVEKGATPRTVNSRLQLLQMILKGAVARDIITSNPADRVERLRQKRTKVEILTPEDAWKIEAGYDALIAAETDQNDTDDLIVSRLIYLFAWGLGLRRAEIQGARWRHVDLAGDKPTISIEETWTAHHQDVPKSEASVRVLQLPTKLVKELAAHKLQSHYSGVDEYIVPNARTGRPLDSHVHYSLFKLACAKAEVEAPRRALHDLRHAFATHAAASTDNAFSVQRRMGHAAMATTQIYVNLAAETFSSDVAALEERQFGVAAASAT
jgi:integrase/recombinase XerD